MNNPDRVALIVGHRGQDGTLLRSHLEAAGVEVIGIGRPGSDSLLIEESIDVRDPSSVSRSVASVHPSEIYYLAGQHGSSESMPVVGGLQDIGVSWETHVAGFQNVLDAVRLHAPSASVVLAASSLVYAPSEHDLDESSKLQPDTVYGLTKAAAVMLARERRRQGQRVQTLILFPHESGLRDESFIASRIVRSGLRIAAGSREKLVIGDPRATGDWSLARDVVRVMAEVALSEDCHELVVANGNEVSVLQLAGAVFSRLGLDVEQHIETDPGRLKRPASRRVARPSRLREVCPWWPTRDLQAFASALIEDHIRVLSKD